MKPIPKRVHGTLNGYNYYGCRCPGCRAANARRWREYMAANPEQLKKHRARSAA